MNWFAEVKAALPGYYPSTHPADIVGYLQGSDSAFVWRSMENHTAQMMIMGSVPPTTEEWIAAGVAQRQDVVTVTLESLDGMWVLYGGFMLRPWGKIFTPDNDVRTIGFPGALRRWRSNYTPPK